MTVIHNNLHWGQYKLVVLTYAGRRPSTIREWLNFIWNFDIFLHRIPFMKTVALISWLIAYFS